MYFPALEYLLEKAGTFLKRIRLKIKYLKKGDREVTEYIKRLMTEAEIKEYKGKEVILQIISTKEVNPSKLELGLIEIIEGDLVKEILKGNIKVPQEVFGKILESNREKIKKKGLSTNLEDYLSEKGEKLYVK